MSHKTAKQTCSPCRWDDLHSTEKSKQRARYSPGRVTKRFYLIFILNSQTTRPHDPNKLQEKTWVQIWWIAKVRYCLWCFDLKHQKTIKLYKSHPRKPTHALIYCDDETKKCVHLYLWWWSRNKELFYMITIDAFKWKFNIWLSCQQKSFSSNGTIVVFVSLFFFLTVLFVCSFVVSSSALFFCNSFSFFLHTWSVHRFNLFSVLFSPRFLMKALPQSTINALPVNWFWDNSATYKVVVCQL